MSKKKDKIDFNSLTSRRLSACLKQKIMLSLTKKYEDNIVSMFNGTPELAKELYNAMFTKKERDLANRLNKRWCTILSSIKVNISRRDKHTYNFTGSEHNLMASLTPNSYGHGPYHVILDIPFKDGEKKPFPKKIHKNYTDHTISANTEGKAPAKFEKINKKILNWVNKIDSHMILLYKNRLKIRNLLSNFSTTKELLEYWPEIADCVIEASYLTIKKKVTKKSGSKKTSPEHVDIKNCVKEINKIIKQINR